MDSQRQFGHAPGCCHEAVLMRWFRSQETLVRVLNRSPWLEATAQDPRSLTSWGSSEVHMAGAPGSCVAHVRVAAVGYEPEVVLATLRGEWGRIGVEEVIDEEGEVGALGEGVGDSTLGRLHLVAKLQCCTDRCRGVRRCEHT